MKLDVAPAILDVRPVAGGGIPLGFSREGRPIRGYRLGHGEERISLIAGCHADEPVGPRFLRQLAGYLETRTADDPLLTHYEWWIIPHTNPDGEVRNRIWCSEEKLAFDPSQYLRHTVREGPGDDIEFGFPVDAAQLLERNTGCST